MEDREPTPWPTPVRQWRVTITEVPSLGLYDVGLSWRSFPCKADEWDGHQYSQRLAPGARIRSAEDLEALLALAVGGAWYEDVRAGAMTPPRRE